MSKKNLELGDMGEKVACDFLRSNGYKIIKRNYSTRLGQIDIVAKDKDGLSFIEVKARRSHRFGLPEEAVSSEKQRQISKVALVYLKHNHLMDRKARFDVVSVLFDSPAPKVHLVKNAFELKEGYAY